ncbi:MAG TPA: hypothetical protein PKI26_10835, partial [Methanothrix sp.]|nr:hypothetical protein [Methanothrix sp.]
MVVEIASELRPEGSLQHRWQERLQDGGGLRLVAAGTPGSGKTSVLMHAVKDLIRAGHHPALVKIDCMWTEDDARFKRLDVPVAVGLSRDMCPDHYAIYNFQEMMDWAA